MHELRGAEHCWLNENFGDFICHASQHESEFSCPASLKLELAFGSGSFSQSICIYDIYKNGPKKMKSVWLTFTGLVRKPEYFECAIQNAVRLRKQGLIEGIVYSTWIGEIDRYLGLRDFLLNAGVMLVEIPDPAGIDLTILGSGNVGRQKIALNAALRLVPNNSYVFKTRPDQLILTLEKIFDLFHYFNDIDFTVDNSSLSSDCPIKYKIWSGRNHAFIPFFIDDRNFFTHVDVAKRMCLLTADVYLGKNKKNSIAEINWFAYLFVDSDIDVSRMLCIDWLRLYGWTSLKDDSGLLKCDLFWLIQVSYFKILEKYFFIGFDGFSMDNVIFDDVTELSKFELPARLIDLEQDRRSISNDERFLHAAQKMDEISKLKNHEKEIFYINLLNQVGSTELSFVADTIENVVSLPDIKLNTSKEVAWISGSKSNAQSNAVIFDQSYADKIDLSIELAATAARNILIDIDVLIHDKNDAFVMLDPSRPLKVGYRWFSADGPLWLEFPRITVERYSKPLSRVSFRILTPVWVGECIVEVDLLIEGERWFNRIAKKSILIT